MEIVAPRINGGLVPTFAGRSICLVGQVVSQDGNIAELHCSDNVRVMIFMNPGSHYGSQFVEIVGIADPNGSLNVKENRACDLSVNFDMANYESLVQLINGKYKGLFYA